MAIFSLFAYSVLFMGGLPLFIYAVFKKDRKLRKISLRTLLGALIAIFVFTFNILSDF